MPSLKGWTNPNMVGLRLKSTTKYYEPAKGTFMHASFDQAVVLSIENNKMIGISVNMGEQTLQWQLDDGAKTTVLSTGTVILPWDPVGLQQAIALIQDLGLHYNGKVAYVAIALGSYSLTTGLAATASDIAICDKAGGLAAWGAAYDTYIKAAHAAFPNTWLFLVASAPPYASIPGDSRGPAALQALVDRSAELYPNFSVMHTALFSTSTKTSGLPMKLVSQYAPTRTTALQFVTSVPSFNSLHLCPDDSDPVACVQSAIDAGIKIFTPTSGIAGKGLVEGYARNFDDPALAPMLATEAAKLKLP